MNSSHKPSSLAAGDESTPSVRRYDNGPKPIARLMCWFKLRALAWRYRDLTPSAVDEACRQIGSKEAAEDFVERVKALSEIHKSNVRARWHQISRLLHERRYALTQRRAVEHVTSILRRAETLAHCESEINRTIASKAVDTAFDTIIASTVASLPVEHVDSNQSVAAHTSSADISNISRSKQDASDQYASEIDTPTWRMKNKAVREKLNQLQKIWIDAESILDSIRRPRPFGLDAFHYLSARSGVQAASIAVGIIILLGIVHTHFFYSAIGENVLALWTWQDLLNEGKNGVLPLLLTAMIGDLALYMATRNSSPFEAILAAKPKVVLLLAAGCVVIATSAYGYAKGAHVWGGFKYASRQGELQVAYLTNGAQLDGVKLAGTTERAAVLLAKLHDEANDKPSDGLDERDRDQYDNELEYEVRGYLNAWIDLLSIYPLGRSGGLQAVFPERARHSMLLDRAHILCLASKHQCEAAHTPEPSRLRSQPVLLVNQTPSSIPDSGTRTPRDIYERIAAEYLGCRIAERDELRGTAYFATNNSSMSGVCATPARDGRFGDNSGSHLCGEGAQFTWKPAFEVRNEIRYLIFGLASNAGHANANLDLSEARAENAAEWLYDIGFSATALELGEAPLHVFSDKGPNPFDIDAQNRAEDRRVEFIPCLKNEPPVQLVGG